MSEVSTFKMVGLKSPDFPPLCTPFICWSQIYASQHVVLKFGNYEVNLQGVGGKKEAFNDANCSKVLKLGFVLPVSRCSCWISVPGGGCNIKRCWKVHKQLFA